MKDSEKILEAIDFAFNYGSVDGAHHKQWTIDQIIRILIDDPEEYERRVIDFKNGEDGPETYEWDEGIAP